MALLRQKDRITPLSETAAEGVEWLTGDDLERFKSAAKSSREGTAGRKGRFQGSGSREGGL